jgi:lipoate-protein ligase A
MRVHRGRAETPAADRDVTEELVTTAAESREPALRVWQPHRRVAFGRRDTTREGYERARTVALDRGYAVSERRVGGHAVAFTGDTVAFVHIVPIDGPRTGMQTRYDKTVSALSSALAELGVPAVVGEPDNAFCPGTQSLSADGKIVGVAQRVRQEVASVAGIVIVRDAPAVRAVLEPVYDALGLPFDPESVGSVADAGETARPETVARTIEAALADEDYTVTRV